MLKDFHATLRGQSVATSPLGRKLGIEIEEFFDATAAHGFPKPDGY